MLEVYDDEVLSFDDGREDLVATPGHRFMTETGVYAEIGQLTRLGESKLRLVDQLGGIVVGNDSVMKGIAYSAKTYLRSNRELAA